MQYRLLGDTGIRVSLIGLGTVKFGRADGLKYPTSPALPSTRTLTDLLAVARDLGINLVDTAPAYGTSEQRLGELISGRRDEWVICTKVGETFESGRSHYDYTPEHTRHSVVRSLRTLRTDYLDIVLIHSDGSDADIIEHHGTLQALAQLKGEGLIRAIGMSHKTATGGMRAVEVCDVVMATLSFDRRDELDVIARASELGCGVLIKKALDSGLEAHDDRRRRLSLKFTALTQGVSSVVVGTTNASHLRDNAEVLAKLRQATRR